MQDERSSFEGILTSELLLGTFLLSVSSRPVGSIGSPSEDLTGDVLTARKGHAHPPKLIKPSLQGQ